MTPERWNLLGEILRNTSGWVALLAAIGTITAMLITNKSRAREAASSEFRSQMQWAADSIAEGDPTLDEQTKTKHNNENDENVYRP